MLIKLKPEPPSARALLRSSLAKRTHHTRHIKALRGTAKVSAPLPVYTLSYKSSSRPHPLRNVRLAGWSYPIVGGASAGLAHLRVSRGTLSFAGITDGPAAQMLLDAAVLAEEQLRSVGRSFEARILEIPCLRIHALWMYSRSGGSQFLELDIANTSSTALETLSKIETRIAAASAYWVSPASHR
jgi:hypothetical protein